MSTVLPGMPIPASHVNLKLGPGLSMLTVENTIIATKTGKLHHSANRAKWWIEGRSKRYVPAPQESVIGLVVSRSGTDGWRLDLGSAHYASLDALAFEGASKRNRPNLKVGSLVYARVSLAHKDMEPELECFDAKTRKSDGFGELKGGFLTTCSIQLCRSLLKPEHYLLPLLGSKFPLQVAIGMNGRVWISAPEPHHIIATVRCIQYADELGNNYGSEDNLKTFIARLDIS